MWTFISLHTTTLLVPANFNQPHWLPQKVAVRSLSLKSCLLLYYFTLPFPTMPFALASVFFSFRSHTDAVVKLTTTVLLHKYLWWMSGILHLIWCEFVLSYMWHRFTALFQKHRVLFWNLGIIFFLPAILICFMELDGFSIKYRNNGYFMQDWVERCYWDTLWVWSIEVNGVIQISILSMPKLTVSDRYEPIGSIFDSSPPSSVCSLMNCV